ncbi:hypothetical protein MMC28_010502 [Mycoblastus sanguinarius]|nr:hypothetical protein [Mycoblastus sanguinarius]
MGEIWQMSNDMAIQCRDHPGRSEYLYLAHLRDHVALSIHHMKDAKNNLRQQVNERLPQIFQEQKEKIDEDMVYLLDSLTDASEQLIGCQEQIKTLDEIKQSQIAGTMQFLLAIYVPLAFVSSYLGMNTVGIVNGSVPTSRFWVYSIPLMIATLLLPLSATILARITLSISESTSTVSLRKWPIIIDICITFFCIGIAIMHLVHWWHSGDPRFKSYFDLVSPNETPIVDTIFAAFAVLKTLEQSILRNRRGRYWFYLWLSITAVILFCMGMSFLDKTSATLFTPFAFMFLAMAIRPLLF